MKVKRLIFWISTTLLALMFCAGALMYFLNYERAAGFFVSLGFPTWLIYPLAIAKILGAVAVLTRASSFLKELAYAGFFYDALLALVAHWMVRDGEYLPAILALLLTTVSWVYDRKVFGAYRQEAAG
ncbi:MAG: DoxX family protein [Acidobacteriota bacterium]